MKAMVHMTLESKRPAGFNHSAGQGINNPSAAYGKEGRPSSLLVSPSRGAQVGVEPRQGHHVLNKDDISFNL